MKVCSKCKENPSLSYHHYCQGCHNDYQKAYYKRNPRSINESSIRRKKEIRRLVKEAKDQPCSDCGGEYPFYVMDLDHVRGKKKFVLSVAASKYRSLKTVINEIAKCDVVCANCHRERTHSRVV